MVIRHYGAFEVHGITYHIVIVCSSIIHSYILVHHTFGGDLVVFLGL